MTVLKLFGTGFANFNHFHLETQGFTGQRVVTVDRHIVAVDSDDDFALGVQVGADIGLGSDRWSLNIAARYLDTSLEVTDSDGDVTDLGFEPIVLSAGVGFRF